MSTTKYVLGIEDSSDQVVTFTQGSVDLASYAFKDVRDLLEGAGGEEFTVKLRVAGEEAPITSLTANGPTVVDVLKSRLAALRKAEKVATV